MMQAVRPIPSQDKREQNTKPANQIRKEKKPPRRKQQEAAKPKKQKPNAQCACGSGKKYKKCCWLADSAGV